MYHCGHCVSSVYVETSNCVLTFEEHCIFEPQGMSPISFSESICKRRWQKSHPSVSRRKRFFMWRLLVRRESFYGVHFRQRILLSWRKYSNSINRFTYDLPPTLLPPVNSPLTRPLDRDWKWSLFRDRDWKISIASRPRRDSALKYQSRRERDAIAISQTRRDRDAIKIAIQKSFSSYKDCTDDCFFFGRV